MPAKRNLIDEEFLNELRKELSRKNSPNNAQAFEDMVRQAAIKICGQHKNSGVSEISSRKFPDLNVRYKERKIGLEVKTSQDDNTRLLGNSIMGSTLQDVDEIYLVHAKTNNKSKCEPTIGKYDDFIEDVKVTHSPRFQLNLKLKQKDRFLKQEESVLSLMKHKNPWQEVKQRAIANLRSPKDADFWWLPNQGSEGPASPAVIRFYSELNDAEKTEIFCQSAIHHTALFGNSPDKYKLLIIEALTKKSVIITRDQFSAGGKKKIHLKLGDKTQSHHIPQILWRLLSDDILLMIYKNLKHAEKTAWVKSVIDKVKSHNKAEYLHYAESQLTKAKFIISKKNAKI
jgi:hypothetical protein